MTKLRGGIGLLAQRQMDYVTIRLQVPRGVLTAEQMDGIANVLDGYGRGYAIPTVRKGLEVPWIRFEDAPEVIDEFKKLGLRAGSCGTKVRTIVACAGMDHCIQSAGDVGGIYQRLQDHYYERDTPTKFKISLSGCPMACSQPHINDFGIIAGEEGFSILVGGKGGRHPKFGEVVVEGISGEDVFKVLDASLAYFREQAQGKERISEVINRNGLKHFREYVLKEVEG
ncbi:MAG: hypothetical protein ACE5G7_03165 [Candidatus Hydrothermarchaeaceae archaeon]